MVDSNRMLVDGKILDESSLSPDVNENASCKEYYWNEDRDGVDRLECNTILLTLLDWNNESDSNMFDIWLHNYFLMIERDETDAEETKTISYQREAFRNLNIPVYYREYTDGNVPYLDLFFDLVVFMMLQCRFWFFTTFEIFVICKVDYPPSYKK